MTKTIWTIIIVLIIIAGGWYYYSTHDTDMTPVTTTDTSATATTTSNDYHDNIYLSATDATKGAYMTDFAGKTLYTFDKDSVGTTTCYGGCATAWPPYTSGAAAEGTLPTNITSIARADGSTQFAWMGKPLYYYAKDTAAGQTLGDGVGGTWHIVKM